MSSTKWYTTNVFPTIQLINYIINSKVKLKQAVIRQESEEAVRMQTERWQSRQPNIYKAPKENCMWWMLNKELLIFLKVSEA